MSMQRKACSSKTHLHSQSKYITSLRLFFLTTEIIRTECLVGRLGRLRCQPTATDSTVSAGNYIWDYSAGDFTSLPLGTTTAIYRPPSHLMKSGSVLIIEPEPPLTNPFLGEVMRRCKERRFLHFS